MTTFHIGQLVACVEDGFTFVFGKPAGLVTPRRGVVYRVRSTPCWNVRHRGGLVEFLRFDEIRNPSFPTRLGDVEPAFEASAFRPLDDRRLDIFRRAHAPIERTPA